MAQPATFKGDFHFVNHDSGNLKALPHRREVFTHVQANYNRWKRQEEARQLRKAAKIPRRGANEKPGGAPIENSSLYPAKDLETNPENHLPEMPSSMLRKGNSDPFNAFPVTVTARVNDLVNFERYHLYPAVHALEMQMTPGDQQYNTKWWSETTIYFQDQLAAYSYLSRIAVVLASCSPSSEYLRLAIVFKNKGSSLLRSHMERTGGSDIYNEGFYRSAIALLLAEIFAGDYAAAAVHTKMLNSLFKLRLSSKQPQLHMLHFFSTIYQDMQRAALSFSRTIFNMENDSWVAQQFAPIWADAQSALPPQLPLMAAQGLDPCIDDPVLRGMFIELREIRFALGMVMMDPSSARQSTWFYIMSRVTLVMGKLTNYIMDFTIEPQGNSRAGQLAPALTHRAYMHAYTSLALLYRTRRAGNIECVSIGDKTAIYNAGPIILARLREAFILSEEDVSETDKSKYANIRLWALHIGATVEQAPSYRKGTDPSEGQWFTTSFGAQARSMGIMSWQRCQQILEGFLYTDSMQPHGSTWFWKALSLES